MNEELDHFFPDRNHLRHFPDDAYPAPRGERSRRRRRAGSPRPPVRLVRVIAYGVVLGFLAVAVIALASCTPTPRPCNLAGKIVAPCVITPEMVTEQQQRIEAENKAIRQKQFELLEQQHKGMSQAMRDFRFDFPNKPPKEQTK